MESPDEDVADAAVSSITNIAMEGALVRDKILQAGCLEQLKDLLRQTNLNPKFVDLAYIIIDQVKPIPQAKYLTQEVIESLGLVLIRNQSVDILHRAGLTLYKIIESSTDHIPAFMAVEDAQTSLLARLAKLSNHDSWNVAQPALIILKELMTSSNEQQIDKLIEAGVLDAMK